MMCGCLIFCPTMYSQWRKCDLLAVWWSCFQQGLDPHDPLVGVVVGLPDQADMAGMDDVQQAIGTDIAGGAFRHGSCASRG